MPEYVSVMDKEREKRRGKERSARLIDALVDKLLREEDDSAERGFIGEIVDKIKLKMTKKQRKSDANGDAGEEE